jgi:phospholipid/cholesterol/gamma-HCH transport system substrate-binding protein
LEISDAKPHPGNRCRPVPAGWDPGLLLLALRVSGLSASPTTDTYKVYAYFDNIAGLTVRAKVTMAGVTIGKVTAIDLDRDSFTGRVTMQLDKGR